MEKEKEKSRPKKKIRPSTPGTAIRTRSKAQNDNKNLNQSETKSTLDGLPSLASTSTSKTTTPKQPLARKKVIRKLDQDMKEKSLKSTRKKPATAVNEPSTSKPKREKLNTPKSDKKVPLLSENSSVTENSTVTENVEEPIYEEINNVISKVNITNEDHNNSSFLIPSTPEENCIDAQNVVECFVFSPEPKEKEYKGKTEGNENEEEAAKGENEKADEEKLFLQSEDINTLPKGSDEKIVLSNPTPPFVEAVVPLDSSENTGKESDKNTGYKATETEESPMVETKGILIQESNEQTDPVKGLITNTSEKMDQDFILSKTNSVDLSTAKKDGPVHKLSQSSTSGVSTTTKGMPKISNYNSPPILIRNTSSGMSGDRMTEVLIYQLGSHSTPRKIRKDKVINSNKKNWGTPETNFFPFHNSSHNIIAKRAVSKSKIDKNKIKRIPSALIKPVNIKSQDVIKICKRNTPKKIVENKLNPCGSKSLRKVTQEVYEITPVRSLISKYENIIKGNNLIKDDVSERVKIKIRRPSLENKENVKPEEITPNVVISTGPKGSQKSAKSVKFNVFEDKTKEVNEYNCKRKFSFTDDELSESQSPDYFGGNSKKTVPHKKIKHESPDVGLNKKNNVMESYNDQENLNLSDIDISLKNASTNEISENQDWTNSDINKNPISSITDPNVPVQLNSDVVHDRTLSDTKLSHAKLFQNFITYEEKISNPKSPMKTTIPQCVLDFDNDDLNLNENKIQFKRQVNNISTNDIEEMGNSTTNSDSCKIKKSPIRSATYTISYVEVQTHVTDDSGFSDTKLSHEISYENSVEHDGKSAQLKSLSPRPIPLHLYDSLEDINDANKLQISNNLETDGKNSTSRFTSNSSETEFFDDQIKLSDFNKIEMEQNKFTKNLKNEKNQDETVLKDEDSRSSKNKVHWDFSKSYYQPKVTDFEQIDSPPPPFKSHDFNQETLETQMEYSSTEERCSKKNINNLHLDIKKTPEAQQKSTDFGYFVSNTEDNDTPTASISMLFSIAENLMPSPMSYADYSKEFYKKLSTQNSPVNTTKN